MIATVNSTLFKLVSEYVRKDKIREYIQGVLIQKHPHRDGVFLVATDGHRMLVAHDESGSIQGEDMIVRLDKLTLSACKDETTLTVDRDGRAFVKHNDRTLVSAYDVLIDATYPQWQRTLPSDDYVPSPGDFAATYVGAFAKTAKELNSPIRLVSSSGDPALVLFPSAEHVFGVLMPVRAASVGNKLPAWVRS